MGKLLYVGCETLVLKFFPILKINKIPIWVRLAYLPLHHLIDTLLEVVGKAHGNYLMVDELSDDMMYSNYAHILVEMDISKGLPKIIMLEHSGGSLIPTLHHEGIPFTCRKYFKIGHLVSQCGS